MTKQSCQTHEKFMDGHEIVQVAQLCSVGSHGVTHRPLSRLSSEDLRSELLDSKQWLEDLVGDKVETISAPGGFFNARVVRHALDAGYSLFANSVEWWNDANVVASRRVVNRVEIGGSYSLNRFKKIVRADALHLARRRLRYSASRILQRLYANR
jgi:peptidoglycan/xylan/chitin deacetylase (PgdA/CDA1 family)